MREFSYMFSRGTNLVFLGLISVLCFSNMTMAEPVLLADGLDGPNNLVTFEGELYFIDNPPVPENIGYIKKLPEAGGPVTTVVTTTDDDRGIGRFQISGTTIYGEYGGYTNGVIFSVPVSGGAPNNLVNIPTGGAFIGAIGANAFYMTNWSNIYRYPGANLLATGCYVRARTADSTHLFFNSGGGVVKMAPDGSMQTLLMGTESDLRLFVGGSFVFKNAPDGVLRVSKNGGPAEYVVSSSTAAGGCSDGEYLYFRDGNTIRRIPVVGGVVEDIVTADSTPTDVTVDGGVIYWSELPSGAGSGRILALNIRDPEVEQLEWLLQTSSPGWTPRFHASSCVFGGKIWIMGGHEAPGVSVNDVWCSGNGTSWTCVTAAADWEARDCQQNLVFNDRMWVIGGGRTEHDCYNDVWSSVDGISWIEETAAAPWATRSGHAAVVYDGKMWVMGGIDSSTEFCYNDVWCSSDGVSWTRATAGAAWPARHAHKSIVYQDKMWVLGGSDAETRFNDIWMSTDGASWVQVTPSAQWCPRWGHASLVWEDKLWVVGGYDSSEAALCDCWYSTTGVDWIQATSIANWAGRGQHTSEVFRNRMWILGGLDRHPFTYYCDVWATGSIQSDYEYLYDDISRLDRVLNNDGIMISYTYDPAGNRAQKVVTSQLIVAAGPANPVSRGIDSDAADEAVLQIALSASADEDVVLKGIEFQGLGTGNDATGVSEVKLWRGGTVLASSAFALDDGTAAFAGISETIAAGTTVNLVLTYTFQAASVPAQQGDTFHASLTDHINIVADGNSSGNHIYALGWPVEGATLTVSTDTTPPTFAGLSTATPQDGTMLLTWTAASDTSTPIIYRIWYSTSSYAGSPEGSPNQSTPDTSCLVKGLVNGQTYYFVVRAEDSVGNRDTNTIELSATPQATLRVLTVAAGPNGTVSVPEGENPYPDGETAIIGAAGEYGYHFAGWTGSIPVGSDTANPLSLTMDVDRSIMAAFTRSKGCVAVDVTPDTASWSFTDGDGAVCHRTGDLVECNISTGAISLTWDPLDNYATPANPDSQELTKDKTVTFRGVYGDVVSFLAPPQHQVRYLGEAVEFSVDATGGLGQLHYQWRFDNGQKAPVPVGTDSPTLAISSVSLEHAGTYWCEATDEMPATYSSPPATLLVGEPLTFTANPQNQSQYVGEPVSFTVETQGGAGTLQYQWKFDNAQKVIADVGDDSPFSTISPVAAADAGTYWCEVTDQRPVTYTSAPATLVTADHLLITQHPVGGTKLLDESHTFTVETVGGFGSLSYVWKRDGFVLPDSLTNSYELPLLTSDDSGSYTVTVSDEKTDVRESNPANLLVSNGLPLELVSLELLATTLALAGLHLTLRREDRQITR